MSMKVEVQAGLAVALEHGNDIGFEVEVASLWVLVGDAHLVHDLLHVTAEIRHQKGSHGVAELILVEILVNVLPAAIHAMTMCWVLKEVGLGTGPGEELAEAREGDADRVVVVARALLVLVVGPWVGTHLGCHFGTWVAWFLDWNAWN